MLRQTRRVEYKIILAYMLISLHFGFLPFSLLFKIHLIAKDIIYRPLLRR